MQQLSSNFHTLPVRPRNRVYLEGWVEPFPCCPSSFTDQPSRKQTQPALSHASATCNSRAAELFPQTASLPTTVSMNLAKVKGRSLMRGKRPEVGGGASLLARAALYNPWDDGTAYHQNTSWLKNSRQQMVIVCEKLSLEIGHWFRIWAEYSIQH